MDSDSGRTSGPLFPNEGDAYCSKQGVINTIRKAIEVSGGVCQDGAGRWTVSGHTFRITGARMLSTLGLDPITVQLLGRWGSQAVLSYLAEAPLSSMAERMGSKTLNKWVSSSSGPPAGEMDIRGTADKALTETRNLKKRLEEQLQRITALERSADDTSDQVEGIATYLDEQMQNERWYVENIISEVMHISLVKLDTSPSEWRTLCGWEFSGKRHAKTHRHEIHNHCQKCPKCFPTIAAEGDSSNA